VCRPLGSQRVSRAVGGSFASAGSPLLAVVEEEPDCCRRSALGGIRASHSPVDRRALIGPHEAARAARRQARADWSRLSHVRIHTSPLSCRTRRTPYFELTRLVRAQGFDVRVLSTPLSPRLVERKEETASRNVATGVAKSSTGRSTSSLHAPCGAGGDRCLDGQLAESLTL
jgi:hypothetical protein